MEQSVKLMFLLAYIFRLWIRWNKYKKNTL